MPYIRQEREYDVLNIYWNGTVNKGTCFVICGFVFEASKNCAKAEYDSRKEGPIHIPENPIQSVRLILLFRTLNTSSTIQPASSVPYIVYRVSCIVWSMVPNGYLWLGFLFYWRFHRSAIIHLYYFFFIFFFISPPKLYKRVAPSIAFAIQTKKTVMFRIFYWAPSFCDNFTMLSKIL